MEIPGTRALAYASVAALRPTPPLVGAPGVPVAPTPATVQAPLVPGTRVQLSPLGQVAGAVAGLLTATSEADRATSASRASRIAEALAVLDRSIAGLAGGEDASADELDFLSGAAFTQRLLAAGLADSVNGRATGASLATLGLAPAPGGGLQVDRNALEQAFRTDPAGVLALVTDYARNLDGLFAQRAGSLLDRAALTGSGGLQGGAFPASLGDFATRQALAAFRANSLL